MNGVIEIGNLRYCIVPTVPPDGVYWPGGPTFKDPMDARGAMKDAGGFSVTGAVAVREQDLWTAATRLITVKGWPVYPLSVSAMALPPTLLDRIVAQTATARNRTGAELHAEIDWGGVVLKRAYQLAELAVGAAIWPPRAVEDWRRFFLLFAAGREESLGRGTGIFTDHEPVIGGFAKGAAVIAPAIVVANSMVAVAQADTIPKWITFRSRSRAEETHGVLPLVLNERYEFAAPVASARRRSSFALESPVAAARDDRPVSVAIDFGTSNTDVAVATEEGAVPRRLSLGPTSLASNLTEPFGLDPGVDRDAAFRFFPMRTPLTMPMSSILLDFPGPAWPSGSDLFCRRAIPGLRLSEPLVRAFAQRGWLKQDFKWKRSTDGAADRMSFLEQLGLLIAWELRSNDHTTARRKLDIVFTRPLAFDEVQTQNLSTAVKRFTDSLHHCGLQMHRLDTMSESLANFYYVRGTINAGSRRPSERHVVVDIGGGSSDISVFSGSGVPLFMDSLYIGGKDLAESLIHYRITRQDGWQPIADLLRLTPEEAPRDSSDQQWTEMCQCLLMGRMTDDASMNQLATDCADRNMRDLLGEIIALLSFATLYAVKLAALAGPSERIGAPTKIWVWYAGLGSRLFNLAPLMRGILSRRESARGMLERAVSELAANDASLQGIEVSFDWTHGKESVSRGALYARRAIANEETTLGQQELRSVWWAGLPEGVPQWSDPFDIKKVRALGEDAVDALTTTQLFDCLKVAVTTVGECTFGVGWEPEARQLEAAAVRCRDHYLNGCQQIRGREPDYPPHPVRTVTDGIKQTSICELIEPGTR